LYHGLLLVLPLIEMGANYFSNEVELNILSEEGKYSKALSE